jgi:holliday junction DNA helicase RuvA
MIGSIDGEVQGVIRDTVVVKTASSIGYRLFVMTSVLTSAHVGSRISLWTHLAVREKAHDLYGFTTKEELHWFELLLTVSGIGPRSALAVMNSADTKTLEAAIAAQDAAVLSAAVGIGKKTAEKIVLELKEKVEPGAGNIPGTAHDGELVDALMSLGYSAKEARDAARAVPKELTTTEERIREAIRLAAGTR